ncbi:hypothetical protein A3206_04805 [Candidatus Methanomassiliicoccus intestinalis]|uniref:Cobyrinate a,c-diamide synthase n=1 Tax=Methanomassiliicoccus intestinalis (strain Issoire-Mx1) TaxID=1295009 RepID=R9TC29_METII|nr:cobyrinate a,c-diamide synthase [Candidatus Methanomassiliicoccus intestinalis]AGN27013.1 cobyrinic acid a,c-diamide synthase [Candidatus Methanomassiliicoccus intestinalis Issoire-Mx1]TQS81008.1 MAG: hypothetical protein A3206_04805 [Candidatus Methanomassiliicoccus intestinalis]
MSSNHPRVVIAGTGSGVGKTAITAGIMNRLSKHRCVQGYKVGPDFIDPMFHTLACKRQSRNLDSFFMDQVTIKNLFGWASQDADISIIEGVRGLYDGLTSTGDDGSTAEIAKFLGAPVILVVNARSLAKSAAAHVLGFKMLDPDVTIAGVILNNVSGDRHRKKATEAVENLTSIPVVGTVEKLHEKLAERHLGLVTTFESDNSKILKQTSDMVENIDFSQIEEIADNAADMQFNINCPFETSPCENVKIGIPFDKAYSFYYHENLESLHYAGACLKYFKPTEGESLPDVDGIYLGGGYPEIYASEISSNKDFIEGLKTFSDDGKLVYGECGGMMTLCSSIVNMNEYKMANIFPEKAVQTQQRQGLSYVKATATPDNFLFAGQEIRSHEFHYSHLDPSPSGPFAYSISRGTGFNNGFDGKIVNKTIGTYMHQHALSTKSWGTSFVKFMSDA